MKKFLLLFAAALLAGCAGGPPIDRSYNAASQDSRAQYLILHFTWGSYASSLKVLTEGPVSSHYLVRDNPVEIYGLVDESRRAYHAGVSSWKGQTALNAASIGIEIVNAGNRLADQGIEWEEYPKEQIDAVIALVKWIVARHEIRPDRILGHSDIAPQRKVDPGPKFPWKRLADEGLIPWPDAALVAERRVAYEAQLPGIDWFQQKLSDHGFAVPHTGELDVATQKVLGAFQMKYRQSRFDGVPDAETAAILDVMTSAPANAP
ncbi:MAG: N-acetylmuramoyl-L-alanine amidase [Betaproteobacteria bacterium]|nr:N-acetylmuramoyl-L-alanine amidase [Betaproteobacteria bacterium]